MATENLQIFGVNYTGVTGIKATDSNNVVKTFVKPEGTKTITANGTGIDVAAYAQVDVNVSSGGASWNTLVDQNVSIVTSSPNYFVVTNYSTPLAANQTYRVTWGTNGTQYICQTFTDNQGVSYDGYGFGNMGVVGGQDTGEPFLIYRDTATRLVGATSQSAGTVHVKIELEAGGLTLQAKSNINPTESSQTIQPDSGYDGLSSVQINAVSSSYVGSGVTRRSGTDLTASGATVTVPAGYYATSATKSVTTMTLPTSTSSSATSGYTSKATIGRSTSNQYINIAPGYNSAGGYYTISAVPNGSASGPSSVSGTSATVSTGTNTLTLTKSVSITPTVSAGYVSSGNATNATVTLTASVTTKTAATIVPTTSNQTIASGTYLTGTQTISGDANLVAANIISGKSIFGVQGSVVINKYYTGSSVPSASLGSNGDIYIQS